MGRTVTASSRREFLGVVVGGLIGGGLIVAALSAQASPSPEHLEAMIANLERRVDKLEGDHPEALATRVDEMAKDIAEMRTVGYGILVAVFVNLLTGGRWSSWRRSARQSRE